MIFGLPVYFHLMIGTYKCSNRKYKSLMENPALFNMYSEINITDYINFDNITNYLNIDINNNILLDRQEKTYYQMPLNVIDLSPLNLIAFMFDAGVGFIGVLIAFGYIVWPSFQLLAWIILFWIPFDENFRGTCLSWINVFSTVQFALFYTVILLLMSGNLEFLLSIPLLPVSI